MKIRYLAKAGLDPFLFLVSFIIFFRWMLVPQALIAIYFFFKRKDLFGPVLFFLVLNASMFITLFPAVWLFHCLAALVLYIFLTRFIRPLKQYHTWLVLGKIDRLSVLLIIVFSMISGLALTLWVHLVKPDVSDFTGQLPRVSTPLLITGLALFFIFNAVAEEFIFRGIFWDGLQRCCPGVVWVLLIQAVYFGIAHYQGFPRGLIGVIMAIIYGLFTGFLRMRDQGLLSPILIHIGADWTIGFLLLKMAGRI